jgi:peptide/nickel transport system permease protein
LLTAGVLGAWIAGLLLAALTVVLRSSSLQAFSRLVSSASLCLPAAAAGVLLFAIGGPAALAIAMAVFPKVFAYAQTLLREAFAKPYAITARASGLSNLNILFRQVLPESGPRLLAVFGISVSLAVGATVPVEAVCDLPGIGQLAWQAAMARDLPLLVALTAIVAAFSLAANAISDIAASPQQGAAA